MTKYDDAVSPFTGAMQRRSLLKLFGRSAIAIAGSAAPGVQALAQRESDEPRDCTPQASLEKPQWHSRQSHPCRSAPGRARSNYRNRRRTG